MHPNRAFRKPETVRNIAFARERAFGVLAVNGQGDEHGPLISHIPFLLRENGAQAELHLVRSNPIVRTLETPKAVTIAVSGGDAYISPDWYEVDDQVPTWNYVAVHLRGTLRKLEPDAMHDILWDLSAHQEEKLLPKKPWTSDKMDQEVYAKMQRQIVPFMLDVNDIQGTWKLSQNKPDDVRLRAANGIERAALGLATDSIHPLMRDPDGT
ncbi:MAG: FMN-binding negative transcriptional regulator [Devosiaceae bacterium]